VSFPPRRVVTGHDADGRAVVAIDEPIATAIARRPGHRSAVLWSTETVPADDESVEDAAARPVGRSIPDGTVFRIVEYGPGVTSDPHRTDSVDYAVILEGEIDLVLDAETVRLRAGDVLVQRATRHDWRNSGSQPCLIAFCLIGARPRGGT
jgi:quercetin dioxygenase-like cupin family protein